jgi:hypothetical protein
MATSDVRWNSEREGFSQAVHRRHQGRAEKVMSKAKKVPRYSQRVRDRWLKKRRWPFNVAVIYPTGTWRISAGRFEDWGEGKTLNEAVDDAIRSEKLRRSGCCTVAPHLITEVPDAAARQMVRAIEKLHKVLTGECAKRRICR